MMIIVQLWRPEVAIKTWKFWAIFAFFWKTSHYGKIIKILFAVFTASSIDVVVLKFCEIYPTGNRRNTWFLNKFACLSNCFYCADSAQNLRGPAPNNVLCSPCSRFYPNRFTFDGVIAERVNIVSCPVEYFHDSPEAISISIYFALEFGQIITRWLENAICNNVIWLIVMCFIVHCSICKRVRSSL